MVSGVSSMMRSTPVTVSMARMFRPSRPMIRPFISSFGRETTETVASVVRSAAQRWMAMVTISLASSSERSLICSCASMMRLAFSRSSRSSTWLRICSLAWASERPEIFSRISSWLFLSASTSSTLASASLSFWLSFSSLFSRVAVFLSRFSSRWMFLRS